MKISFVSSTVTDNQTYPPKINRYDMVKLAQRNHLLIVSQFSSISHHQISLKNSHFVFFGRFLIIIVCQNKREEDMSSKYSVNYRLHNQAANGNAAMTLQFNV